jgi:hypothetical protein
MKYQNIDIEEVNIAIFLKDKDTGSFSLNERFVYDWLRKNKIKAQLENPIDDLVLVYPSFKNGLDIDLLTNVYKKAESYFPEVKVNLYLSHFTQQGYNSKDMTLDEFKELYESQKEAS